MRHVIAEKTCAEINQLQPAKLSSKILVCNNYSYRMQNYTRKWAFIIAMGSFPLGNIWANVNISVPDYKCNQNHPILNILCSL